MKKFLKLTTLCLTVIFAMSFLVACGIPVKPAKARKNLEKEGYTNDRVIELVIKTAMGVLGVETDDVICATKVEEGEMDSAMLVYCKSKETAKKMEDKIIEELRKEYKGDGEVRYGRDGKVIYFGTEDGIEDCN